MNYPKNVLMLILFIGLTLGLYSESMHMFSYFKGNGEDGLHLAYSSDGLTWTAMKNDTSFLTPEVGGDLMRDPCIIQGPNGKFHMVWTSSWYDDGLGIAHSDDLINWSEQTYVPVMEGLQHKDIVPGSTSEATVVNTWAPEIFYDARNSKYIIYWSSQFEGAYPTDATETIDNRCYYTTTTDFVTYTPTALFLEPGFNVIDPVVVDLDPTGPTPDYRMVLKDETQYTPSAAKNLRTATSTDLYSNSWNVEATAFSPNGTWCEGPTLLQVGSEWYVYYDRYKDGGWGAMKTSDFNTWTDETTNISFPSGARHGTAFTVDIEVFNNLQQSLNADEDANNYTEIKHRFSFDGAATDSIGTADLTLNGAATVVGGKLSLPGGAVRTDNASATGDSLTEIATTINGATTITMEAWFKADALEIWRALVSLGSGGYDCMSVVPYRGISGTHSGVEYLSSMMIVDGTTFTDEHIATSNSSLNTTDTYYVSACWDTTDTTGGNQGTMTLRIGSVGGTLTTYTSDMQGDLMSDISVDNFFLGSVVGWNDNDFNGEIDEFRIWTGAINSAMAYDHFTTGPDDASIVPPAPSVPATAVHQYTFIGNAEDSIGTADLTLNGTATIAAGKLELPGGSARTNYASATGAALTELATTINSADAITVESWFTVDTLQNWSKLFTVGNNAANNVLYITPYRGVSGSLPGVDTYASMTIANGSGEVPNISNSQVVTAGTQCYVSATWDPSDNTAGNDGTMTLRIGPVGGTISTFYSDMSGNTLADLTVDNFFLGAVVNWPDSDLTGSVDQLTIWNGALTDSEAETHFSNGPVAIPQAYNQTTCTQTDSFAFSGSEKQKVIGIEVEMDGSVTPYSLKELQLDLIGHTFLDAVKIYSTGTSSTFDTTTEIATASSILATTTLTTTPTELAAGTNYFWVAVNVDESTAVDSVIDANCSQLKIDNGSGDEIKVTATQDPAGVLTIITAIPERAMASSAIGTNVTQLIDTDIYFYGFNKTLNSANLDEDENGDWSSTYDGDTLIGDANGITPTGASLFAAASGSVFYTLGFDTGNQPYTLEFKIKIGGVSGGSYDASFGYSAGDPGSSGDGFYIADDHVRLGGNATVNTPDNTTEMNTFRYAYVPSGNTDGTGHVYIFRNDSMLGYYENQTGTGSTFWFGDWTSKMTGDFSLEYLAITAGATAPLITETPVLGLEVTQTGTQLIWSVAEESNVTSYQVVDVLTGELITTVLAGELNYQITLPEGVNAKLVVVDNSGFEQTFYPNNGSIRTAAYDLVKGWNLISIVVDNADLSPLTKVTTGEFWSWDGVSYQTTTNPEPTQAVWVYSTINGQVLVSGTKSSAMMAISTGWNMVGPTDNCKIPEAAHVVYTWNDTYNEVLSETDILIKGIGYWIFSF